MTTPASIAPNSFVTLDYVLTDEDGGVLDDSRAEGGEPIEYVHGYGMLVPGLEARLAGLKTGEKKKIVVPAAEAFGERDMELVLDVERSEFPEPNEIEIGDEFIAESPDGDEAVMRVIELKEESVVVDANHPLAGVTLNYDVEVVEVREATEEEIEEAAEEMEAAEAHHHDHDHEHDENCGHVHPATESGEKLVTLGAGKPAKKDAAASKNDGAKKDAAKNDKPASKDSGKTSKSNDKAGRSAPSGKKASK